MTDQPITGAAWIAIAPAAAHVPLAATWTPSRRLPFASIEWRPSRSDHRVRRLPETKNSPMSTPPRIPAPSSTAAPTNDANSTPQGVSHPRRPPAAAITPANKTADSKLIRRAPRR